MISIQKSYSMKQGEIDKKWFLVDAKGKILGRLASEIAKILRGKNKPSFTPHLDMGDNVIVINAKEVALSGEKNLKKDYFFHSQYPGGEKFVNITKMKEKKPEFIIEHAVKGMLPKNRLGRKVLKNLKIYGGEDHPHKAQQAEKIDL